jgi:hypothetical protein
MVFSDQQSCLEAIGRLLVENVPDDWVWIRTEVVLDEIGAFVESVYQTANRSLS